MSMTKQNAERMGVDFSPTPADEVARGHAEEAAEECQQALDAIVAMFPALDILADRASRAAGYGSPMHDRILAGFMAVERGIDMLRRERP